MDWQELGLNKYEIAVYKGLLSIGKSSAAEISKESQVPYGRIYDILTSLHQKGLVTTIPEKTKKFIAASPEVLKTLLAEKKKLFDEKAKMLEKEISELKPIHKEKERFAPVQLVEGKRNFYKLERTVSKPKKSEYYIKYTSEYQPVWEREVRSYKRKKIEIKTLTRYDEETKKNVEKWLKTIPETKKINNEGIALSIIDDKEVLISLIKSNVTLLIKDVPFAKIMKQLFLDSYNSAQPIK